ncbi:MAG: putative manganese transporter [Clostridia bacterium]
MWDVILDALIDSLKVLPFVVAVYIIIELVEHKFEVNPQSKLLKNGYAPLFAAATGLLPQCGFSVMAAKLYDKKLIRTGTIMAVFLATSDEAMAVLITSAEKAKMILPLLIIKLIFAVAVGYAANFLLKKEKISMMTTDIDYETCGCGKEHTHSVFEHYFLSPFLHLLKVFIFIFLVNVIFGIIIFKVGEDKLAEMLSANKYVEPLLVALVGLIPNCASSVVITQAYVIGGIHFGSCIAGLCVNAGLGYAILLKNTKEWKRNLLLISSMYVLSVLLGILLNAINFE